ncbi:hybrid sensor histidine kinase/response regulator [Tateyamaria omphalii]|uniref:histidine kinase n=2 Tax=Tateyamaria omphalii TaxID=299262 RepID=A0A1P8N0A7_9RHOB|nr:hybrid sensor histidine kinase/response regulator [Tateyamaria omphalii]
MSDSVQTPFSLNRPDRGGSNRAVSLLGASALLGVMGALAPERLIQLGLLAAALTFFGLGLTFMLTARRSRAKQDTALSNIGAFIEKDASPSFVCTADGEVLRANAAARQAYATRRGETLAGTLRNTFANPGGILFRLKGQAAVEGAAREDIVTRRGHMRLAVHHMDDDTLLWRLEAAPDTGQGRGADGPGLPMLMVGRTGAILYMNESARKLIGSRVKTLESVFDRTPVAAGAVSPVTTNDGPVDVLVTQIDAGAGRHAYYLLPPPENGGDTTGSWASFEDLPVPLVRFSPEGDVRSFNRSAADLIGPALAAGEHISDLMAGLGRPITDWLEETVSDRAVQQSEFLRLSRSDKEMFVQVALNRMQDDGEVSVIAVLADATELKTLEAQFVQSQKMQAIGQLAGGVAHDFNNLLTAISGHCDLLLLRHDQGDPDYSDLVQINQNANRAAALVGQLLAFSRKQTLRPEELDLRDTMSDLTHLLNRLVGEKVTLTLSHDPILKPIRADKRQLEQVLMNLVVNARDAMPEGGEIQIQTESMTLTEPLERDRVNVPAGEYICLRVVDQGVGISPDKLQKVFEPFYTTKKTGEGTGLGLSTAYGIVKQTGGFIFVDSTVGQGTCFSIIFPVIEAPAAKAPAPKAPAKLAEPKHGDGVILLVEDEAPVRAFASRALRLRGYTVLEADSAEAALKTLEDASLNVDLFVTDVVMPGKDGPSWVREALQERPDVRVVFVSGYAEDRLSDQQRAIPNSVFLPKPFSLNDLAETVHQQLH